MRVLITLFIIILVAAVIIYFLPGTIHIEKTMVLKAQTEVVYEELNTTGEWKKWAGWLKEDPMIEITYHGPESDAGAALNWISQVAEINTGNVLLESSQEASQVKALIQFDKYGKSGNSFVLRNTGNGTQVNWTLEINAAEKGFPSGWINKIKAFSWKGTLSEWMDASLKNLDEVTANMEYHPKATINDTLVDRLDSLNRKVDSLKNLPKQKDTVYP
ncbi:hypothetical protein BH10BAC2_BH10BAC2_11360 [soil metagenome]